LQALTHVCDRPNGTDRFRGKTAAADYAAPVAPPFLYAVFAAGNGCIDFHEAAVAAEGSEITRSLGLANTVSKKPGQFIGDLQRSESVIGARV